MTVKGESTGNGEIKSAKTGIRLLLREREWKLTAEEVAVLPKGCILKDLVESCSVVEEAVVLNDIGDATVDQFDSELRILLGKTQTCSDADLEHLVKRFGWWRIATPDELTEASVVLRLRMAWIRGLQLELETVLSVLGADGLNELAEKSIRQNMHYMQSIDVTLARIPVNGIFQWHRLAPPVYRNSQGNAWCKEDFVTDSKGVTVLQGNENMFPLQQASLKQIGTQLLCSHCGGSYDRAGEMLRDGSCTVWKGEGSWTQHVNSKLLQGLTESLGRAFPAGEKLKLSIHEVKRTAPCTKRRTCQGAFRPCPCNATYTCFLIRITF